MENEEKILEAVDLLKKAFGNMDQMNLTKTGMTIKFINSKEGVKTFTTFTKAFDMIDNHNGRN